MRHEKQVMTRELAAKSQNLGGAHEFQDRQSSSYLTDSIYTNYSNNINEELNNLGEVLNCKVRFTSSD